MLSKAMQKHQAGDIEAAEALYANILSEHPYDADVLNLMGVLSLQRGELDQAHSMLRRAVEADPRIAAFHNNLGQVLRQQGRDQEAMASYKHSLMLDPELEIARTHLESLSPGGNPDAMSRQHAMKRFEVVQQVLNKIGGRTYLEIGIDTAESFVNIRAARKFGIDPVPTFNLINQMLGLFDIEHFEYCRQDGAGAARLMIQAGTHRDIAELPRGEKSEFFYMTSDTFFEKHAAELFKEEPIDTAFVDGLHTYQQTYQDVLNILDHLAEGGVILMHDCNPPSAAAAHPAKSWQAAAEMGLPGWQGQWCGDVWKAIAHLRAVRHDLNVFVLDCDFGIGVVSKATPEAMLNLSPSQIQSMTYADLTRERQALINLKPQEYLYEFLQTIG